MQQGFGQDRAGRVPGAEKQYVEARDHGLCRRARRGNGRGGVGSTATAGLGEEAEQVLERRDPGGVADLAPLPGGVHQPRPLQPAEVEGGGRSGEAELAGDLPGREAVPAGADQQANDGKAAFLGEGGADFGDVIEFHVSI